jgi:hypothetical protein
MRPPTRTARQVTAFLSLNLTGTAPMKRTILSTKQAAVANSPNSTVSTTVLMNVNMK